MCKVLRKLIKLSLFLAVVAVAGCVFFYVTRKEHFNSVGDFVEELIGTLGTLPMVCLLIP